MGYVNNTHMRQFVGPDKAQFSAGTWTDTVASNVWSKNRTAADAAFVVKIPVDLPGNAAEALEGATIEAIELFYVVGTAAMDSVAAALYKTTLAANGTLPSAAAVTTSYDTGHDAAAERITVDEHRLKLTVTTPALVHDDGAYHVELSCDAAATSVFKYLGALIHYKLRI